MHPPLSIVMPVRNGLPYLDQAIESILAQSFGDFEFIIGDDGSTDGSTERLREWVKRDRRIRLLESVAGQGPAGSSNWVAREARAPLIARMDADDISHPDRLRKQMAVMDLHPDASMVASLWRGIDERGEPVRQPDVWRLARSSVFAPFAHGSILCRRQAFLAVGGYREQCDFWEDLDLVLRLAGQGKVLVLPDTLYEHRLSAGSTRLTSRQRDVENAVDFMYRCVAEYRRTGSYDALLRVPKPDPDKVSPDVFISLGSNRLWVGKRPGVLKRMLGRGSLGWNAKSAAALAWALWAQIAPRSLRYVLAQMVRFRNDKARTQFRAGTPALWLPGPGSLATPTDRAHHATRTVDLRTQARVSNHS